MGPIVLGRTCHEGQIVRAEMSWDKMSRGRLFCIPICVRLADIQFSHKVLEVMRENCEESTHFHVLVVDECEEGCIVE